MHPTQRELLDTREAFYAPTGPLESAAVNCGDERPVAEQTETDERSDAQANTPYVHVFGGGLFPAYNTMVLAVIDNTSVPTFAEAAQNALGTLQAQGITGLGVHSDTHAEHDTNLHTDHVDGPVGCGYAQKRAAISELIYENGDAILDDIRQLRPDLLADEANLAFAQNVLAAHGLLAQDTQRLSSGRAVVLAAVHSGAHSMVVDKDHIAHDGIINAIPNTSIGSGEAYEEGMPTYDHDIWASTQLLQSMYPNRPLAELEITSLIDIIGTMRALGVTTIAYRSEPNAA